MKMRRLMSPRSPSTRRPISASIWLSPQPLRHSRESGIPAPRALPAAPDPRFRGVTVTPTSIFIRTSRIGGDVGPVICRHQLRPAAVKPPLVAFAVAVVAGPGAEILVEALVSQPHLVTEDPA